LKYSKKKKKKIIKKMSELNSDYSGANLVEEPHEEVIDIVDAHYSFNIDENLFTEDRGNWIMNDFNMKNQDNKGRHSRRLQNIMQNKKI